jgi:hypothetical protein
MDLVASLKQCCQLQHPHMLMFKVSSTVGGCSVVAPGACPERLKIVLFALKVCTSELPVGLSCLAMCNLMMLLQLGQSRVMTLYGIRGLS